MSILQYIVQLVLKTNLSLWLLHYTEACNKLAVPIYYQTY